ncbi:MAG: phosphotransferase [Ghiorsea sp.]
MDSRLEQAKNWLNSLPQIPDYQIRPLAGDASFRRYFRVSETANPEQTYVLMDAPPEKEDTSSFLQVCDWLEKSGLNTPKIIIKDQSLGFILLHDFGDTTWSVFNASKQDTTSLFKDALQQLHKLQSAAQPAFSIPFFDVERMQTETNLYLDWYLPQVKNQQPTQVERGNFHQALLPLLQGINTIPKAPVHLDYHSRNLMVPHQGLPLGVIDFQDAVAGPITYDLASLLYDCYQDYPEALRLQWSKYFFNALSDEYKRFFEHDFNLWHHMLRLTALQRHIKAIGIFARLAHRDGKKQFLEEIPLTRKHLDDELKALSLNIPLLND